MAGEADAEAVAEEARRLRRLRTLVDLTTSLLTQQPLAPGEAEAVVAATRRRILELFPDKEATYELILAPRFARLVAAAASARRRARVLPFRPLGAGPGPR